LFEEATGSSFVLVNSCFSSASSLERIGSPYAQIPCHKEAPLMKLHQRPIAANKKREEEGKQQAEKARDKESKLLGKEPQHELKKKGGKKSNENEVSNCRRSQTLSIKAKLFPRK
jgi:hypothetical protein